MSNSYYNNTTNVIVDGTSAEAADVENKLDDVAAGLDLVEGDMNNTLQLTMADLPVKEFNITAALRANMAIGFDNAGNLTAVAVTPSVPDWGQIINDSTTALSTTWSSTKINTELSGKIDDVGGTCTDINIASSSFIVDSTDVNRNVPELVDNFSQDTNASVTPDMDNYTNFQFTYTAGVLTINDPTIAIHDLYRANRTGMISVTGTGGVTFGPAYKMTGGIPAVSGFTIYRYTAISATYVVLEIIKE